MDWVNIEKIYKGQTEIVAVYIGDSQAWPQDQPIVLANDMDDQSMGD